MADTVCESVYICCLYKKHAQNDDAVFVTVKCLSLALLSHNIICQKERKLDSALSVFSVAVQPLAAQTFSVSDDFTMVTQSTLFG